MEFLRHGAKRLFFFSFGFFICVFNYNIRLFVDIRSPISQESMEQHRMTVNKYYHMRKDWVTSNLGTYLFKYAKGGRKPCSYVDTRISGRRSFNVLIWKHWMWLKGRHVEAYGKQTYDPLAGCSVSNCIFSGDDSPEDIYKADAVVVHLQKGFLPDFKRRDARQLWIFWSDESPRHTFSMGGGTPPSFVQLSELFNWSMTYRSDSDIPIPYGRTIPLPYPKLNEITNEGLKRLVPFWKNKRRDVLAANIMSHCVPFRMTFLKRLQRFISIDTFGRCATVDNNTRRCPGHFKSDCPITSEYLFYVVMENSNCRQYISEKVFHHAYSKGAIPIIMGAPLQDCIKLLPPHSFIHIDHFNSLQDLVKEVYLITNSVTRLLSYHVWRNHFEVMEEHGFLGTRSFALCRLCEALNYNKLCRQRYRLNDIRLYLDPKICCVDN